jgi:hypothetical protein
VIPSRTLSLAVLGLWLVFLSTMQIPIIQFIEGDPPSIYNTGDGGMTELISALTIYRKVKVVEDLRDVWVYSPESAVLVLAGLSKPLTDLEVESLIKWVGDGGHLVILDEYTTPTSLLWRLGLSMGGTFHDIVQGSCRLGARELKVLFDVYREVIGGETVCSVGNTSVAASKVLGEGKVTVIGDSSIFINEVMRSTYRQSQMSFALDLLDRDTVLFYEGGREFKALPFSPKFVVLIPYYVLKFVAYLTYTGTPYDIVKVVVGTSILLAIVSPRPYLRARRFFGGRRRQGSVVDVKKTFNDFVAVWIEWVGKHGRENRGALSSGREGS